MLQQNVFDMEVIQNVLTLFKQDGMYISLQVCYMYLHDEPTN